MKWQTVSRKKRCSTKKRSCHDGALSCIIKLILTTCAGTRRGGWTVKIFLIALACIIAILLIVVIISQEPKTAGMGAGMGGGGDSMLGGRTRGKDAVLAKMTVGFGVVFVLICLLLGRYMNTF